jgi:hypothetical protein
LYAFFTGRLSTTGFVLKKLGVDVDKVRELFAKLGETAVAIWDRVKDKVAALAATLAPLLERAGDAILEKAREWGEKLNPVIDAMLEFDVEGAIRRVGEFFTQFGGKVGAFLQTPLGKTLLALLGAYLGKKAGDLIGSNTGRMLGEFLGKSRIPGSKAIGGWMGEKLGTLGGSMAGIVGGAAGALAFGSRLSPGDAGGGATIVSSPQQNNEIHVHGSTDVEATAKAVGDEIERRWDTKMSQASEEMLPLVPVPTGG